MKKRSAVAILIAAICCGALLATHPDELAVTAVAVDRTTPTLPVVQITVTGYNLSAVCMALGAATSHTCGASDPLCRSDPDPAHDWTGRSVPTADECDTVLASSTNVIAQQLGSLEEIGENLIINTPVVKRIGSVSITPEFEKFTPPSRADEDNE